ncbi:MAG: IS701 family transposase [Prevotella sp.]|jgi:SRSO17 transposase|nr:IS701 family transposase [Prevotella sp.]
MNLEHIRETIEQELANMMERIGENFSDRRGRQLAKQYVTGLMSTAERKNGWQLAETLGQKTPYAIQQFLYRGGWAADDLRDDLRTYVKDTLGDSGGVLVVDETGFLKKGKKSAGVMRQYSGTAGRIENCQIGVFLTYAAPKGFAVIDRGLYLPKEWVEDIVRRREAGIPEGTEFTTKPKQALNMMKAAYRADTPFSWVTADSVYGDFRDIAMWLESISKGYVMAVSGKAYVWQGFRQHRVSTILSVLPDTGWERISSGAGSKGERYYDWLSIPINSPPVDGWKKSLLVRASTTNRQDVRAFICFYPDGTSLNKLAEIAGVRWTVEQSFEEAKGELGLDHYEVRSYSGWYKHITLSCWALALLAALKMRATEPDFQAAIDPLSSGSMNSFKKGRGL